jgi:Bacterial membrane protein YfhO
MQAGADRQRSARPGSLFVLAGLAAFSVSLFPSIVVLGQVLYERDIGLVWISQVEAFVRAVRTGHWPLWDSRLSFGQPLLANPNVQALYPPTWLNLILPPWDFYSLYVFAHLSLSSFGLYLLALRKGWSWRAAALASAVWASSGPLLSLANVWHHFAGACWLPWVFLAAEKALSDPSGRAGVLLGLAGGLQLLAGSPDLSIFTILGLCVYSLPRIVSTGPARRVAWRILAVGALAALVAAGLSAGQWVPSLAAVLQSARRDLPESVRTAGSLHPLGALLKLFSPAVLWQLPLQPGPLWIVGDAGQPFVASLYLGGTVLLLSAGALAATGRREGVPWLLVGLVGLLLAMGSHSFVYRGACALFPPLRMIRFPVKATALVAFAWAMLAGLGFERWRGVVPGARWARAAAVAVGLVSISQLAGALLLTKPDLLPASLLLPESRIGISWARVLSGPRDAFLVAAVLSGAAAALSVRLVRRGPSSSRLALLAVLSLADLWWANHLVNRTAPRAFYRLRPPLVDVAASSDRVLVSSGESTLAALRSPLRAKPAGFSVEAATSLGVRLYLLPPVGGSFGLSGSYDPDLLQMYPPHLARLVEWARQAEGGPRHIRYLQMGGVRHVSTFDADGCHGLEGEDTLPGLFSVPIRHCVVPGALPRAYLVGTGRPTADVEARALLEDAEFPLREEVLLSPGAPALAALPFEGEVLGASIESDSADFEVVSNRAAYLVVVDTFDAGWRASIDGAAAPIYRANVAFRAVRVPAGRHFVRMRYRPLSVTVGLALSVLTLLAAAIVLGSSRAPLVGGPVREAPGA